MSFFRWLLCKRYIHTLLRVSWHNYVCILNRSCIVVIQLYLSLIMSNKLFWSWRSWSSQDDSNCGDYCCWLSTTHRWGTGQWAPVHYGVGSWSLYTKQATPGSPPLLCRGHPTQSATSTMEPQGFQWALTQWRRSPVKVTRSPWDYFLKTQNGWQPTCVDMQNNVENVFVECTIYFLTIMQLTEAGLSIWQVQ